MITKKLRDFNIYDLKITDRNGNSFFMTLPDNMDLYWIPENHKQNKIFEIDNSDFYTFTVFEQLYDKIIKITNSKENFVTFITDDYCLEEADILKITKTDNLFTIEFIKNNSHRGCSIRFCNSGSRNPQIQSIFMKMFSYLAHECNFVKKNDNTF